MRVEAPGRVNLIGDHTDYTGGLCLPMAIDRGVTVDGDVVATSDEVRLCSDGHADAATIAITIDAGDVGAVEPEWARYVAGVVARVRPAAGFSGTVTTTLPIGVGLSSSAALEVAVALALGADADDPVALARLCQAAEHDARGVPTGLLDQLACICGVAGHALLLDCRTFTVAPVPLPPPDEGEWVVVVPSGSRSLAASGYAARVAELRDVETEIGPVRDASLADVEAVADPTRRRRARHVVTENERVTAFATAIADGDLPAAGRLMGESHASMRDDFDASTVSVDDLCHRLTATTGVLGARMTGGGWGGAVIALARPGVLADLASALTVRPSGGARRVG